MCLIPVKVTRNYNRFNTFNFISCYYIAGHSNVSKIITLFFYENKADISSVIIASASTDKYMWAKLSMTYCYYFILMQITPCLNNQL